MLLRHDAMGAGPPIVLLHGGFSQRRVFGYQVLSLARTHRVVAVDLPGHGKSSWDPQHPWFPQAVRDTIETVRHLGLDRPTIVGWSIGANVARGVAAQLDDSRLVLVGAPAKALDESARGAAAKYVMRDFPRYVKSVIRSFPFAPISSETEDWLYQMALATPIDVAVASVLGEIDPLPQIPPDAALIHGVHDQIVPLEERIQGSSREYLFERSGHLPFIEESKRFDEVITEVAGA